MLRWLARRLLLDPHEVRLAAVLGGVLFTLTSSYTLVKTARDALYLDTLPAETLPWVFMGVAAVTLVAAGLFTAATRRRTTFETLAGTALASAISLGAFAWLFRLDAPWIPVVLYLWVNVYGLLLMSQFWVFTNSVSNPREAKRIFGFIGVGGILGGLAGGFAAPALAISAGLSAIMIVAAFLLAAGVTIVVVSVRERRLPPSEFVDPDEGPPPAKARNYLRWLALAALCSVVVTGIVDYQFKVQIQARYDGAGAIASFLGLFHVAVNLAALVMQLVLTRWALQRLGAGWSSAILPTGLGIGAAITMWIPGFAAVVGTRLWDQMIRQSINRSAVEMFYFPLEPGLRRRAKSIIDAGIERAGDGLAGALILLLALTLGANVVTLAILTSALIVIWVAAWLRVRAGYVSELGRNLRRMNLAHEQMTVSLREASVLAEMKRLLESPYERVVIHALELMQDVAPDELDDSLPPLLGHGVAAVRARALTLSAERNLPGTKERAAAMLEDESPDVRVAALRAFTAIDCDDPLGVIQGYMESEDRELRLTAIQCAIEYTPAADEERVRPFIERLVNEGSVEEREAVIEAIGRRPRPSALHGFVRSGLRDPSLGVRRSALRSAGRIQQRSYIPALLEALEDRSTQDAAREGLAAFGDRVVGTLGDWLADHTVPLAVRREIPRILGTIATQEAVNALFRVRERSDVRLSYRILKALNRIRVSGEPVGFPRRLVTEDLEHDVHTHLFAFVHYRACPIGAAHSAERFLCQVLNERMEQSLNRMFRRLALLYPARDIHAAYRGIVSEDRRLRGNAIEYIENALAPEHRALVLPLVDDSGDESRLRLAEVRHGMRYVSYHESLQAMLEGDDAWLRTCALYVVGARRERGLEAQVTAGTSAPDPMVRETAVWARSALGAET